MDEQSAEQTLNLILQSPAMGHQSRAVRNPTPKLASPIVGLPDFGKIVTTQKLSEHLCVHLIGLHFGFGNRFRLEPRDEGPQDLHDRLAAR
jgi:hypothetical protein